MKHPYFSDLYVYGFFIPTLCLTVFFPLVARVGKCDVYFFCLLDACQRKSHAWRKVSPHTHVDTVRMVQRYQPLQPILWQEASRNPPRRIQHQICLLDLSNVRLSNIQ